MLFEDSSGKVCFIKLFLGAATKGALNLAIFYVGWHHIHIAFEFALFMRDATKTENYFSDSFLAF